MHSAKLSKSIALLKRAKCFVTHEALIKMYNSLVLPHFTYCSNVWKDGSCAHMEKLYKMQKRAARIVTGCSYETRSREIFERLGWEPIKNILKKREIITVFKALKGALPASLCEKFSLNKLSIMTNIICGAITVNSIYENLKLTS